MTNDSAWIDFLDRLPGKPTDSAIAAAAGVTPAAVSRWRSQGSLVKPDAASKLARAFGFHPLTALVAAGYLTREELDLVSNRAEVPAMFLLEDFSTSALAVEVARRLMDGV